MPMRVLLLTALILASCADQPRTPPIAYGGASTDRQPRQVLVKKVWDDLMTRVEGPRDPNVSHFVEVEVQGEAGERHLETWPYDAWACGQPPPKEGTVLIVAPADWLTRDPRKSGGARVVR